MVDAILTIFVFAVGMGCVAWFTDICLKDAAKPEKENIEIKETVN